MPAPLYTLLCRSRLKPVVMLRKPSFAVFLSSLYLVVYMIFVYNNNFDVVFKMFLGAPFVLAWLAYTIIRFGKFDGRELREGEGWGYADKGPRSVNISDN